MSTEIDLMTEKEVADLLRVSVSTVRGWRRADEGPPWFRVGRVPRYQREEVIQFLEEQRKK